jgi:hypothetical protein
MTNTHTTTALLAAYLTACRNLYEASGSFLTAYTAGTETGEHCSAVADALAAINAAAEAIPDSNHSE